VLSTGSMASSRRTAPSGCWCSTPAKIGAILVDVNPAYRLHELDFVVRQCGMRMLITAPPDSRSDYVGTARAVLGSCPDLTQVVVINNDGGAPGAGETDLARVAAAADSVPEQALRDRLEGLGSDDPINLQYTSWTTGLPKGATLTHRNILNNGYFIGELLGDTPADRGLHHHRGPDEGHGHPGRREDLSPRNRGLPLHPSGHPGRAGHPGTGREVRRGTAGLRHPQAGCGGADGRGHRPVLPGRLAHYKIPKYVEIYREFPMAVSGKIRKGQMREAAAERLHAAPGGN